MYRSRLWTIRQYAGFGSARQTNERFRYLLAQGQTGLSVAFDLPTQMGFDSDHPLARGEVGRVGVAISCLADMEELLAELPLDRVTTSMTINATAPLLLAFYVAVADARGTPRGTLGGTVQNDVLKEYIARGTYIYPPRASLRLITDVFEFTAREVPQWNSISVSGYHMREAGSTAVQELAFTLADGLAYLEAARERGLDLVTIARRMSFFLNAHNHLFEEVAKFRAARKLWAELLTERFGIRDPEARKLRFHTQTAGSMLTAQQPLNNVVRVTLQGLAGVLGGTQSLHTNSFDEALGLPSRESALLALRTQQVLAHESGAADTVDPLAGSYWVEAMTAELERRARALLAEVAAELAEKQVKAGYYEKLEANRKDYQSRVQTIQEIARSRRLWSKFLDELIDVVNNDGDTERHLAWFDGMTVGGDPKRGINVTLPGFVQGNGVDKQSNLYDDIDAGPFAADIKSKSDPGGKVVNNKDRDPPEALQFSLKLDFWPLVATPQKGAKK
jgi:methylmalonyl-CoA mutase N-terminal domain/subunit